MSVVSENHGGRDAPEVNLRHRCFGCGKSLVGEPCVVMRDGDACKPCCRSFMKLPGPSAVGLRVVRDAEGDGR